MPACSGYSEPTKKVLAELNEKCFQALHQSVMKIGFGMAIGGIEKLDHLAVFEEVLR